MALNFDDAVAQVCAPGSFFSLTQVEVRGQTLTVFEHAPPTMRAFFDGARAHGDKEFIVYEDERWSFTDLFRRSDQIGAALVERYGVTKGDRVGIAMRNYPEWPAAFAAICSIGAIVVPLNAWWSQEELDYGVRDCGAKVVVGDVQRLELLAPTLAATGARGIAVRSSGADVPAGVDRLEDLGTEGAVLPEVDIHPDDDVSILYTSGTTGHPKGAVSSHRAVLNALLAFACRVQVATLMDEAGPESDEPAEPACFILAVPLFHVTGCVPVMLSTFALGLKLVMMYKWDPVRALQLVERERVTNFVGVPTMAWDMLEVPEFDRYDTSSLRAVGGGGAPAPPELVRRIEEKFSRGRPNIGYGMTETNAYGPSNSGDPYLARPTSCGRPVPIMEVRIADESGAEVPAGRRGEILFRGSNLFRGYWEKPEANAEAFVNGWFRSGDIGRVDDEGYVYVEDRAKDMVLRGGENIYCAEVEAVIYEHPAVYEAAVFGVPHPRLGEELACAVVLRDAATLTAEELQQHVREHLAAFKVPAIVEFFDEQLPRNAAGKILKRDIRDTVTGRTTTST